MWAIPVAAVAAFFISFYALDPHTPFSGSDTPQYVWRANLVIHEGLDALPTSIQPPLRAHAYRAGHPVLAASLDAAAGVGPVLLAYLLPALMATVAALAAGAIGSMGLREPRWAFPVYAVVLGTSAHVTLTAAGRSDALILQAIAVAAAGATLAAATNRRGVVAGIVLLTAGLLTHWSFTVLVAAILGAFGVLLVPGSLTAWRVGGRLLDTPAARIGAILGGAALAGVAWLSLLPSVPELPRGWEAAVQRVGRHTLQWAVMSVAALLGIAALLVPRDVRRRRGLALLALWGAAGGVALIIALLRPFPAHRVIPFALGIPLLAAAGLAGLGRLASAVPPAPLGRVLATVLLVAGVFGSAALGRAAWTSWPEGRAEQLEDAALAGRYLRAVGGDRPVIFVANLPGQLGPLHTIRSALPPEEISRTYAYYGDVDRLLAREPTDRPGRDLFSGNSLRHWEGVREQLGRDPIILVLASFYRASTAAPGTMVAPGLTVVRGPGPPAGAELGREPFRAPTTSHMIGGFLSALALLALVGLGWAASLLPRPWLARAAMAPALGIAVVVLGGAIAERLGVAASGRLWVPIGLLAAGWLPFLVRRRGSRPDRAPLGHHPGQ